MVELPIKARASVLIARPREKINNAVSSPCLLAFNIPHSKKVSPGVRKGVGRIKTRSPAIIQKILGNHQPKSGQVQTNNISDAPKPITAIVDVFRKAMQSIAKKKPATFQRASRLFSFEVR